MDVEVNLINDQLSILHLLFKEVGSMVWYGILEFNVPLDTV